MGIFRDRPIAFTDNTSDARPGRNGRYGEAYVYSANNKVGYVDEGSYFTAVNATLGTGIAGHAAPVIADTDTKTLLHIFNGGQNRITLDYVWLRASAIGAGSSTTDFQVYIDTKGTTAKTSGGTVLAQVNSNSDSIISSGGVVTFGAVVTATSGSRKVAQRRLRSVVSVVEDHVLFNFGSPAGGVGSMISTGTLVGTFYEAMPPVVIGPGHNFCLVQSGVSQSGANSYEVELGFWER